MNDETRRWFTTWTLLGKPHILPLHLFWTLPIGVLGTGGYFSSTRVAFISELFGEDLRAVLEWAPSPLAAAPFRWGWGYWKDPANGSWPYQGRTWSLEDAHTALVGSLREHGVEVPS